MTRPVWEEPAMTLRRRPQSRVLFLAFLGCTMRHLRRKLTLRAHGEQMVFIKRKQERIEHVWMKAFLWAIYLPTYPDLEVEVDVNDKYKPDVVAMDLHRGRPQFWAEAGAVGPEKIRHLVTRYPDTPLAFAKWDQPLRHVRETVGDAMPPSDRTAPIDFLRVPEETADQCIDGQGRITIGCNDVDGRRAQPGEA